MRAYGSIQTHFWGNTKTHQLSDQGKLLITYLKTSPHTTMLGCFRLPMGYIESDLGWDREKVDTTLNELTSKHFILYDAPSSWLLINDFLEFNPIGNPKQGMCVKRLFESVPVHLPLLKPLIKGLLTLGKHLPTVFIDRLHSLQNELETVTDKVVREQEQNKKIDMSNAFDVPDVSSADTTRATQACEVLDFLNKKTGRVYRPVADNLKFIMGRLKSGASVMDCRQVIAKKTREWKDNPKMSEYLRPITLFHPVKFEQYMGELVAPTEEAEYA